MSSHEKNVKELVKIGRCRWKIENETFNTLKNQGYHIEHNFGHGQKHLSFNFFLLNLLAFFMHQIFELTYAVYQELRKKFGSKKNLWDHLRTALYLIVFPDIDAYFEWILHPPPIRLQGRNLLFFANCAGKRRETCALGLLFCHLLESHRSNIDHKRTMQRRISRQEKGLLEN